MMQKEKMIEILKEELSVEDLMSMTREINSWDGSLEHLNYWENNDDFFETFYYHSVGDLVRALSYGNYHYTDEYVTFDVYGNIVSMSNYEVEDEIQDCATEIIERYLEVMEKNPSYFNKPWDDSLFEDEEEEMEDEEE